VRFRSEVVRLLPALRSRDGDSVLELLFHWPDGSQSALDELIYLRPADPWSTQRQPSFVLRDGAFWLVAEEPPQALVARFAEARFLPVPPEERAQTIGLLSSSFPHLRRSLCGACAPLPRHAGDRPDLRRRGCGSASSPTPAAP
jgi:hypothetical protein